MSLLYAAYFLNKDDRENCDIDLETICEDSIQFNFFIASFHTIQKELE